MTRFAINMTFEIIDAEAEEMNATFFGKQTQPALSGGFSTHIEADDTTEALTEGLEMALRFNA